MWAVSTGYIPPIGCVADDTTLQQPLIAVTIGDISSCQKVTNMSFFIFVPIYIYLFLSAGSCHNPLYLASYAMIKGDLKYLALVLLGITPRLSTCSKRTLQIFELLIT